MAFLNPDTFGVSPPRKEIASISLKHNLKLLEFGNNHRFWFPEAMLESDELWSEYLVAFWDHPMNFHRYLRGGATLCGSDMVIDCGACEGFFTRAALDAGVAKVICVEPSPIMAKCLRMTFESEIAEGRVIIMQVALGSFPGHAGFSCIDEDAFSGHFDATGGENVEVVTLDQIAKQHGEPSFIKMDLEGFEYQALHGGMKILHNHHPKLGITTYHNSWDFSAISSLLREIGYAHVKPYGVTMRGGTKPRPVMVHAW